MKQGLGGWVVVLALTALAEAQVSEPLAREDVPAPLSPWVDWALDGVTDYGCTWVDTERRCVWPGRLSLELREGAGELALDVTLDHRAIVALPGGAELFPQDVRVGGRPVPVLLLDGEPVVELEAGAHRITGRFAMSSRPELLPVPPEIALIDLEVDGAQATVRRNDDGDVWLRGLGDSGEDEEGHLELEVFRKLDDGVPFCVVTQIVVRASGEARELRLGNVLLEGLTPTELRSELAARLEPDGSLVVQARAGSYAITVVAHSGTPLESLSPPQQPEPWPAEEVWVWNPEETMRQVELSGAPNVDAARTNLPAEWRDSTAYMLTPDRTLTLETTRRGESMPPPNAIELRRELWLDLDGAGYTGRDRISGRMNQGFRIDLLEGELGRVAIGGTDQLITESDEGEGIEVRSRSLDLVAEWRDQERRSDLMAVGWSEDVQQLNATLHLPPGWMLVGSTGVDDIDGTWFEKWNLWSIFFVLVVALGVWRLTNIGLGLLALITLTLCYHEVGAPLFAWMFFVPLLALRRVVPEGRAQKLINVAFWISTVALVLVVVPFSVTQLRSALYPFTAPHAGGGDFLDAFDDGFVDMEPEATAAPMVQEAPMEEPGDVSLADFSSSEGGMGRRSRRGERSQSRYAVSNSAARPSSGWVDPNAVVQTGPGVPAFGFQRFELRWSGPVRKDHEISLWLIPPWLFRLLAVLRVLNLMGLVVMLIWKHSSLPRRDAPTGEPPRAAPAAAVAAIVLLGLFGALPAQAQSVPPDTTLNQLRERMLRPPSCGDHCVMASDMEIEVRDDRLRIEVVVNAVAQGAYRLPGPSARWVPERVEVDGRSSSALMQSDDRFLLLRLEQGVHRVELQGPIAGGDTLTLAFGEPPASVRVDAPGWDVDGVRADGRVGESIQLQRLVESTASEESTQALPAWLVVKRRIELGVRWLVHTSVERISPVGSPVVLRLPLIEGERVTEASVQVQGDALVVNLGRDDRETSWTSVLEPQDELVLNAAESVRYSEEWTLACSPIWHCEAEGLAPIGRETQAVESVYQPWPGESITIKALRPVGAEGQASTIDQAGLILSPGVRLVGAELTLTIRASQGGTQTIELPAEATVQSLRVDGENRPIQQAEDGSLRIGVAPGSQRIEVRWQEPGGHRLHYAAPEVKLGGGLVNAEVRVRLPDDRWLLWATGPDVAVLFWPYLLLVLLVAFLLGLSKRTPLGILEWALLGLGLTMVPAPAAVVVVGWFFLMEHRRRTSAVDPNWFTFRQLLLVLYTVIAVGCLYAALHIGLLMQPDMQIESMRGGSELLWYVDRTDGSMPRPAVWSVPLWAWRVLMLIWALWLAFRLFKWGKWGWGCFTEGGLINNGLRPRRPPQQPMPQQQHPPMQQQPQAPMQQQPQAPMQQQPQAPMQQQPQAPMQSEPQAPTQSEPQPPMQQQPQEDLPLSPMSTPPAEEDATSTLVDSAPLNKPED